MVKEAESHADEDRRLRENAEVRNEVDSMCYSVERQLRELGDKVSSANRMKAEEIMGKMRTKLSASGDLDVEGLKNLMSEMRGVVVEIQQDADRANAAAAGDNNSDTASEETTDVHASDAEGSDKEAGEPVA